MVERLVANEKVEGSSPFARSRNLKYLWKIYLKKMYTLRGWNSSFDQEEIHKYLKKIDGWNVLKDKENNFYIEKQFKFKDYIASEKFIISVGKIAENEGHHPDISFDGVTQK